LPYGHSAEAEVTRVDNMHVEVVITRLIMDVHPDATRANAPVIVYNSGSVSPEGLEHGQVRGLSEIADTGYVRVSVECEEVECGNVSSVPFHVGEDEEVRGSIKDLGCFGCSREDILDPEGRVSS